jgi:hypothetical protein
MWPGVKGAGDLVSAGRLGGIEPGRTLEVAYDPVNPKQVELT